MLWFVIGIALWVLLLLVCWVALDGSLVSSWISSTAGTGRDRRRPQVSASDEPGTKEIERRTFGNHNKVSP